VGHHIYKISHYLYAIISFLTLHSGKIADLTSLKAKLQKILKAKRRKFVPDSICPLIEASEKKT
jgi:hypothetical protein